MSSDFPSDFTPSYSRDAVLNQPPISALTFGQFGVLTPSMISDVGIKHNWAPRVYIGVNFNAVSSALCDEHPELPVLDHFADGCAFVQCRFREGTLFGAGCEFCAGQRIPASSVLGDECVTRRRCHIEESVSLGDNCEIGVGVTYDCAVPKSTKFVRRRTSSNPLERMLSIRESQHATLPAAITNGTAVALPTVTQTMTGGFELMPAEQVARNARKKFSDTTASNPLLDELCYALRQRAGVRDADVKTEGLLVNDVVCRITTDAAGQKVLQLFNIESALCLMCETPLSGDEAAQRQLATLIVTGAQNQLNAARSEVGVRQALVSKWDAQNNPSTEQLEALLNTGEAERC